MLIVRTLPYNADEMIQILNLRAGVEGIEAEERGRMVMSQDWAIEAQYNASTSTPPAQLSVLGGRV